MRQVASRTSADTAAVMTNLILTAGCLLEWLGVRLLELFCLLLLFCLLESGVSLLLRLPLKRSGASFADEFEPIPPKQTKEEDPQRGNPGTGTLPERGGSFDSSNPGS